MPALPADIGAASRDVAVASWSDPEVAMRYPSARDGAAQPADGYFDAIADAQTVIDARATLIGVERRRFTSAVASLEWPDLTTGLPQAQLADSEQAAGGGFLVSRIELDLDAETSSLELFG